MPGTVSAVQPGSPASPLASRTSPICRSHSIACEPLPIAVFGFPGLGDLVRCHSLIQMIAERNPDRPIDLIARRSVVAIGAFMPQIRDTIGDDFRHNYLTMGSRLALAKKLRNRGYGSAYIIQSSFKAALVPFLARIPERIGWADEGRLPLLTRPRFGLRRLPRMVDRMCWLGVADGEEAPAKWPEPRLQVPDFHQTQLKVLRESRPKMAPVVAIAPGSSVLSKNWPVENYAAIARRCVKVGLHGLDRGIERTSRACGGDQRMRPGAGLSDRFSRGTRGDHRRSGRLHWQ